MYPLPSHIFVCWSMYQIFDSSSLWSVSLVKRFPNLVAFADRGQLQTVPWSFPEESYWDLIFSERCSLQSMSGPLSHLGTPVGPVAMACISVPSTTPGFLKRRTAAVCLFSATLLPQHPWDRETASLAKTEIFHQHNSPTHCHIDVSHVKRERVVVAFLNYF